LTTGEDFLLSLEEHRSSIDQETGPRPYVYSVVPGGLVARWRGSALAWPLVDGELLRASSGKEEQEYLCALHRGDSFIMPNPGTTETRTAVYQWNGFGFSGVEDPSLNARCRNVFQ
jgi:poly-gamma-glutamate synthesis protein (capsule biosynthesis protein)